MVGSVVGFPGKNNTVPGKMGNVKWDLVGFSLEFHELPNMIFNRSTSQKHDMY